MTLFEPSYPPVEVCRRRAQALAMLDAILCPAWEDRCYAFTQAWAPGEQMASMRDGSGDAYFTLFTQDRCAFKVLEHELAAHDRATMQAFVQQAKASAPGGYERFFAEPAFDWEWVTAIGWYDPERGGWLEMVHTQSSVRTGEQAVSALIQPVMSGSPEQYAEWAEDYFGVAVNLEVVSALFSGQSLTPALVQKLNPDRDWEDLLVDLGEIGYPVAEDAAT